MATKEIPVHEAIGLAIAIADNERIPFLRGTCLPEKVKKNTGSHYFFFEVAFGINATLRVDFTPKKSSAGERTYADLSVTVNSGSNEKTVSRALAFLSLYERVVKLGATIQAVLEEFDVYFDLKGG